VILLEIKNEVGFGLNPFQKVDVLNKKDSIAQIIKNILFLRPGQIPSMPFIGVDIAKYINPMIDNGQLEDLGERMTTQCRELIPYMEFTGITAQSVVVNNRQTIVIVIPLNIGDTDEMMVIGVTKNTDGRILFKYELDDSMVA
jgi:hypothetical protein